MNCRTEPRSPHAELGPMALSPLYVKDPAMAPLRADTVPPPC